jgi:uncharacterized membrane protein
MDIVAGLWGIGWWLYGGLAEIDRFVSFDYELGAALGFVAFSLVALHALGLRWSWPLPGRAALCLLPLVTLVGLIANAENANHPAALGGWGGWPALLAAGYFLLLRQDRTPDAWADKLAGWLHPVLLWSLALLVSWELSWHAGQQAAGVWTFLPWGLVPALALWLLGRSPPWPAWPLAQRIDEYRMRGAVPIVAWLCFWSLYINLGSDGDPIMLPYFPLLNPLDVAMLVALFAAAAWWLSLSAEQRERFNDFERKLLLGAGAALVLLWLSASLVRSLHYLMGTPIDYAGISDDARVHAGLSIFWGVLGFGTMLLATRRGWRKAWLAGAGLMGVVVVKLFFFDLDESSQITRIVSFITIGVLMLITGYFSPLPPRATPAKEAQA